MSDFYITLSSNVKSIYNNTVANFVTKLYQRQELYDYEVGLSEISYTKGWYNVSDGQIRYADAENRFVMSRPIDSGFYNDAKDLVAVLNNELRKTKTEDAITKAPEIIYDQYSQRVVVHAGHYLHDHARVYVYPVFDPDLELILGLADSKGNCTTTKFDLSDSEQRRLYLNQVVFGKISSCRPVDLSAGLHSLYVYCDIINPQIVGDSYT